jgi:hypothetical protein
MRIAVLLVVVLAACAGRQGDDPVIQSPPPDEPTAAPADGDTLTGTLGGDAQLEGGCAWIDDGDTRWEVLYPEGYTVTFDPLTLVGPDGPMAEEGATVTVTGAEQSDMVTICQVGPVWQATDVRAGG